MPKTYKVSVTVRDSTAVLVDEMRVVGVPMSKIIARALDYYFISALPQKPKVPAEAVKIEPTEPTTENQNDETTEA